MRTLRNFILIILITSCAPKPVNLNGDVFLTLGGGNVKPIAGAEIYLFPLETDFDSSFVLPLKNFINNAKYNIAESDVAEICEFYLDSINTSITNPTETLKPYIANGTFIEGIENSCLSLTTEIESLESNISLKNTQLENRSQSIRANIVLKEAEAKSIREAIYRLALNEGNKLKNIQMQKITFNAKTKKEKPNSCYSHQEYIEHVYEIVNSSDYIIKSVQLGGPQKWNNEELDYENKDHKKALEYIDYNAFSGCTSCILAENITKFAPSKTNSYGETIPGLAKGGFMSFSVDKVRFQPFPITSDRWYEANRDKFSFIKTEARTDEDYSFCEKPKTVQYQQLDFRDLIDVEFGYPIKETVSESKEIAYTTETINWVEIGRKTETYINSKLHDDLKKVNSEIEIYKKDIALIEEQLDIQADKSLLTNLQGDLESCNGALLEKAAQKEANQCVANLGNQAGLVEFISNANSYIGGEIQNTFNAIDVDDLGYDNFEQLLNAFGESRNALRGVTTIQGAYNFAGVTPGKYVLFTYYEDRFNGAVHWLEEINIEADARMDLNNLNLHKEGVYSYLRDKIEN